MLDGFSILPLKCSCFYAFVAAATRKVNKYNNNDPESVGFYEFLYSFAVVAVSQIKSYCFDPVLNE